MDVFVFTVGDDRVLLEIRLNWTAAELIGKAFFILFFLKNLPIYLSRERRREARNKIQRTKQGGEIELLCNYAFLAIPPPFSADTCTGRSCAKVTENLQKRQHRVPEHRSSACRAQTVCVYIYVYIYTHTPSVRAEGHILYVYVR